MSVNREYKDSVFSLLFSDKARLLELYNAIEGTSYTDAEDITINTLQDVLFMDRVNDLSFKFREKQVVLIEHESTINPNMALRMLMYIARLYEKIIDDKLLYSRKQTKIPRPEFIVLYNGRDDLPAESTMTLSGLFEKIPGHDSIDMELKVKVYNINKGCNPKIESQSEPLRGYAELVAKARTNQGAGMGRDEAIKEAVKQCRKKGVLSDFLKEHGSEVENMLLTEWNWDDAFQVCKEESKEEGIEIGKLETALNMKNFKMPLEEIAKYTGLPLEKLAAL
jgi:hypothetical protein